MPKRNDLKKILVIGSGPIVIGQAAEFDYAGTQACQALKEEGYEVILINSNPATIMTDTKMADQVYLEPLTFDFVHTVIRKERPCGLLATLGGQTALNLAVELAEKGVLERYGVQFLGTDLRSIEQAEDREQFRALMQEIGEPVVDSEIVTGLHEARSLAENIGYPVIIRPAYTLGGTGGGIAHNEKELAEIVKNGLKNSPKNQVLLEKSIAGFKELEYEVMRDQQNNAMIVCNMENIDPVGIHTGDSIVVAPSQTLSDRDHQMLRDAALRIIRALEIEGGCNVQFALDPKSDQYYVIEVNPRVSRSSALASKATGYPIAKIAAKIAVGYRLDELQNPITKTTQASFEPALDYVVCKIPRWPFDKFRAANRTLGTQMKATGEVMAIGRNFEESLLKAVRSLEIGIVSLRLKEIENMDHSALQQAILTADDRRLFMLAEAFRRGVSVEHIYELTKIDRYFLQKIHNIIAYEQTLTRHVRQPEFLFEAKRLGFSDRHIAECWNVSEREVNMLRQQCEIRPVFKMVDTCAAEFVSKTPYYYATYEEENESEVSERPSIAVIGSGPIRIGQGIEFDYATVHTVWAIRQAGYEAVIINNNPETVSTDFSISDKLYFEPLTVEDVMNVIEHEKCCGAIVQFGGQTAINLASGLKERGVTILGTSLKNIDRAEDRDKFEETLKKLDIPMPEGKTATSKEQLLRCARNITFPLLVRPSYVLGGRAMEIVHEENDLLRYVEEAIQVNPAHPVLLDQYVPGKEVEVDAVADGETVVIPGVMEHIERAGVHSGDSIAVYPSQTLSEKQIKKIEDYTVRLARELEVIGLINIQFVARGEDVFILEANPRSSRTVPFISKVTGVPLAKLATKAILGEKLSDLGYQTGLLPEKDEVFVKVPVFSFAKLRDVDISLGPEMKSTGEVMGKDRTLEKALYKGLVASGIEVPRSGAVLFTVADKDKAEALALARRFVRLGFDIVATEGTEAFFVENGLPAIKVGKISSENPGLLDWIRRGKVCFVVNTLTKGRQPARDGFQIRRASVENGVLCLTSLDTVRAMLDVIESMSFSTESMIGIETDKSVVNV